MQRFEHQPTDSWNSRCTPVDAGGHPGAFDGGVAFLWDISANGLGGGVPGITMVVDPAPVNSHRCAFHAANVIPGLYVAQCTFVVAGAPVTVKYEVNINVANAVTGAIDEVA